MSHRKNPIPTPVSAGDPPMTTAANPQIVAPLAHCLADAPG